MIPPPRQPLRIAHYLALAERLVLIMIAIVLSVLAVLLLGSGVVALVKSVVEGTIRAGDRDPGHGAAGDDDDGDRLYGDAVAGEPHAGG